MTWLLPPILWVVCLGAMGLLTVVAPVAGLVPPPYFYAGFAVIALGLGLLFVASRQFAKARTNINTFRNPDRLVSSGLFAVSRNPMYLGFVLTLLGAALAMNALTALLVVPVFFLAAQFWYIPFEERAAAQAFGAAYDDYRRRVRRWI